MRRYWYSCKLLSDVVLHQSSATEANLTTLDYIPGSVFLGVVAKKYSNFGKNSFDVFHSGKTVFGDAHISENTQYSLKSPLSWHLKKGDSISGSEVKIHNYPLLLEDKIERFIKEGVQLKQVRESYFLQKDDAISTLKQKHRYSQKSAYDSAKRKSEDSKMYGYNGFIKGSDWVFYIQFDNSVSEETISQVDREICGYHYIGRSKTSQYGEILVKKIEQKTDFSALNSFKLLDLKDKNGKKHIFLYALSNIALVDDETGFSTAIPTIKNLELPESCEIDLSKTQIRVRRYRSYNFKRESREFERLIIEKGSVIAIKIDDNFDFGNYSKTLERGVGAFLCEGFGKFLVNPQFLVKECLESAKKDDSEKNSSEQIDISKLNSDEKILVKWLQKEDKNRDNEVKLLEDVLDFIKYNYSNLKKATLSQWGQIRAIAGKDDECKIYDKLFKDDDANPENSGYCVHGVAKDQWKPSLDVFKKKVKEYVCKKNDDKKEDDFRFGKLKQFLVLLSMEISKKMKQEKKKGGK